MKTSVISSRVTAFVFMIITLLFIGMNGGGTAFGAASVEPRSLQQWIDETPSGGMLKLPAGNYEGPVTVNKPMRIVADGEVLVRNDKPQSAILVQAEDVFLQGLRIVHNGKQDSAAVWITGNRAVVEGLMVETQSYGIVIRDSGHHEIRESRITWTGDIPADPSAPSDRRNGIDLFNSHDNRITGNTISTMNDGIYLESSHRNRVEGNQVDHSRYGIHCMYTDGTVVSGNRGAFNVTGAMVMGVKDAEVRDNIFVKQSESVNSQGLLFFDVKTSRIFNNRVEGNRVGLYVEQSHRNEFRNNDVLQNFTGVQFLESEGNRFTMNRFIGNVIEAEASESKNNAFEGNYWEAFRGIDTTGDGISELPYVINPFFQKLTSAAPAFQLFFQSPGLLFLESLNTADKDEWAKDEAPYLRPDFRGESAGAASSESSSTLAMGVMLLLLSSFIIYFLGVKRV